MQIQENVSLKPYNTFGIDVKAKYFVSVSTLAELKAVVTSDSYPHRFILGGGSNILFTANVEALVIHNNIKGIEVVEETDSHVYVKAGAGENWHQFVLWCIERDFGGIENLALIYGNAGTAPIQNIGAYGVELKDVFYELKALELATTAFSSFSNADCEFGYRDSVFKRRLKGKYIITSITLKMTKRPHRIHCDYGAIKGELAKKNCRTPDIKDICEAVVAIRQRKLPDPATIGNSGSFFKNPVITTEAFYRLKARYPDIPGYTTDTGIKVPAAWLIERCGFKGRRFGDAGVHKKQALVLVNHGTAKGVEVWRLAEKIRAEVNEKFNIFLETEVNIFSQSH